jgi:PAS domain S-box-containing protein
MSDEIQFSSEEAKLKDSLERYEQLINETPICIKVFDATGKLIFLNKGGRDEHFVKDTDDISKWDWAATVKKEYQAKVLDAFQRGLKGEASHVEMEHTSEGSKHSWCEGVISPIKNDKGEVTSLLFYSIDATEKKLAEKKLLEKETDLKRRNEELEKMNKLMVGRELKMVELKNKLKETEEVCKVDPKISSQQQF